MACIVMAYIVMAYIVMASVVMACAKISGLGYCEIPAPLFFGGTAVIVAIF